MNRAPMRPYDLKEIEQRYHSLAASGEYAEALQLATRCFDLFPTHAQRVVYYWRLVMACKLGDTRLALDTLRRAVADGHWYDGLAGDPDLAILTGQEDFEELVGICEQRRREEIAKTRPLMKILEPTTTSGTLPLVFALHGNNSSSDLFASHWEHARQDGWLVALPQAPQSFGPGTYSWNDWDWARQSLVKQYAEVCESQAVDPRKTILAGFSMGAGLALWLAMEATLEARGVLCVAPFLSEPEALEPFLAQPRTRQLRIYLVASPADKYCHEVAVKLSHMLTAHGVQHKLDVYTDVGHAFPASFEARLPSALDFILNGS